MIELLYGRWINKEKQFKYDNGASLLIKGYECSECGNFIHRKSGKKNFCDYCGADMREEAE